LQLVPTIAYHGSLASLLNRLFAAPLAQGELDFLHDQWVGIHVADAPVSFTLTLRHGKLLIQAQKRDVDLDIEGSAYAFMLLASRQEDADTLFFRRQLKVQGNTELGLQVKNFLDGLDLSAIPLHGLIETALRRGLWLADRIDRLQHRQGA